MSITRMGHDLWSGRVPVCTGYWCSSNDCVKLSAMAERNFVFLRYEGKIPAMAGCAKCQRKFFTPAIYSGDADGAQEYLFSKFDRHECEERPKKSRYAW